MPKRLSSFLAVLLTVTLVADPLAIRGFAAGLSTHPVALDSSALFTQEAVMQNGIGRYPGRPLLIAALTFLISLGTPVAAQQSASMAHDPSGVIATAGFRDSILGMSLGGLGILDVLRRVPTQGPMSSWSDVIAWWRNAELAALDWLMIAIIGGAFGYTLFEILAAKVGHRNHSSPEHVQVPLDPLEQQARYYASHEGALARSVQLKKNKQLVIETDPQGRRVVRQRASRRWLRPPVWAPYIPSLFLVGLDIYILKQPSFQEQLFDLNFASFLGLALGVIGLDIGAYFFIQSLGKKLFSAYFRWDRLRDQRKEIRRLKKWLGLDWRRDFSHWASSTRPLLVSTSRVVLGVAVFLFTVALPANGSSAPTVPPPPVLQQAA